MRNKLGSDLSASQKRNLDLIVNKNHDRGPADNRGAHTMHTHEESISAANSNGRKFLYNSKVLDADSLLVK